MYYLWHATLSLVSTCIMIYNWLISTRSRTHKQQFDLCDRSVSHGSIPGIIASSARPSRDAKFKMWQNSISTLMVQVMLQQLRVHVLSIVAKQFPLELTCNRTRTRTLAHTHLGIGDCTICAAGGGCWTLRRWGETSAKPISLPLTHPWLPFV